MSEETGKLYENSNFMHVLICHLYYYFDLDTMFNIRFNFIIMSSTQTYYIAYTNRLQFLFNFN